MDKYLGQISKQMWIAAGVGLLVGLILGVLYGWVINPIEWEDAPVSLLRADLQQDYLAMAIQSHARNPNPALAQQRWAELGENAAGVLGTVQQNAPVYGLNADEINAFAAVVQAVPGQPGATPPAQQGPSLLLLAGACLLTLALAGAVVYLLLFRNRAPALARGTKAAATAGGVPQQVMSYPEGQEPPIAQYLTTYTLGNDLYDDSFSIDSPSGEFLGECGVGISETIGVGDPKKVAAFEVWLFDKNDIQTVTKVLMSAHAFNDPTISQRLASKGEPVLAEPGKRMVLETATLQLEARVVNMNYGQSALPQSSNFDQMTLELAVWPKVK
jgi:hypothetical protein